MRRFAALPVLGILLGIGPARGFAEEFRVGAAEVEITPEVGSGQYRGRSSGVHDPLFARALVFQQGEATAALVVCDVIGVSMNLTGPTREKVERETGIPAENVSITATHTHTGPRDHNNLGPDDDDSYAASVRDRIVRAVAEAKADARPATIHSGVGYLPDLSFNRRFHLRDGTVRMNPGFQNPEIVRPEGPIDPDLTVILFRDTDDGSPFAALTNFALHLDTVGGNEYSADYPSYLHQALKERFGKGFVSVFGTGCCGDLNHFDVRQAGPQRGHEEGHQTTMTIGKTLADQVLGLIPDLREEATPSLEARREIVRVPLQRVTDEERAWASRENAEPLVDERPFLHGFRRNKIRSLERLRERWGDELPMEVHALRLTDETALVTLPGEIFTELGLAIKAASPFPITMVIELGNDSPAYVPTKRAFANGDYEAVNSRVAPGGGETLVDVAGRLLDDLKPSGE